MPGQRAVRSLGGPLGDEDLVLDPFPAAVGPPAGFAQRPAGAQARGQLAAQRAAALNVEGLVDRLVRDPHRLIVGELLDQPSGDLLRAPLLGLQLVLYERPQPRVICQLDRLWAAAAGLGLGLRRRGPVAHPHPPERPRTARRRTWPAPGATRQRRPV